MKTDSQIQADVIQELKWDPSVTHEKIGVTVSDSIVTLSGMVPSYVEKYAAEKAAQRVAGVKAVVEKTEVELPFSFKRTDQDIASSILHMFKWNIQVPDELVKVNVEKGWVELSGEVEWAFQKKAAEKAVRGITGVRGVTNAIALKVKDVKPAAIKEKIAAALKRNAENDANKIQIDVLGSKVTLSGNVSSFSEKEDAKWAAWSAPGVSTVQNNLNVVSYQ
jgi:osmotically-inducible protein OsmY